MEKKKSWALRPVAWICTLLMMSAAQIAVELIRKALTLVYFWLNGMSTIAIILLVLLLGSVVFGFLQAVAVTIPSAIVSISDMIYPSKTGDRFLVLGSLHIVWSVLFIFLAILGYVSGGLMFMFYAQHIYLIIIYAIMIMIAKNK